MTGVWWNNHTAIHSYGNRYVIRLHFFSPLMCRQKSTFVLCFPSHLTDGPGFHDWL